jgi:hypothetical protein
LYKEEYAAYEDLGAFLEAIIRWNKKEVTVPFESILRYKDDKVALGTLFKRHKISNLNELIELLNIDQFLPISWSDHFPKVDCRAGLIGLCAYIAGDCVSNQKEYGVDAYNKIKHGLALFPSGNKHAAGLPDCPAVIISNRDKTNPDPYTLMTMPMNDISIEQRAKTIEFIQATTRTLAALYVIGNYPGHFRKSLGIQADCEVFLWHTMSDVWSFFRQIANKYADEAL